MNYENIYRYLCFCCADAVDCGAASPRCMEWVWVGMDWVDLTWMSMDRYGLGFVLDDGCGWYKGLDSSLCSE